MPIPLIAEALYGGVDGIPFLVPALKLAPWIILITAIKLYFGGSSNSSERVMHSKVVMITGGTSGVGASIAQNLASRGAQIILLTHAPPTDPFLVDYIDDLRTSCKNQLIYAEQVDLSSLHSIRQFATRWIDNVPPRRLDVVILCASTMVPRYTDPRTMTTEDGLEACWGINYLANFHLLSILSPAIRAQPPDRDVRIVFANCPSYIAGDLSKMRDAKSPFEKGKEFGSSKLALMVFAQAFQKHLDAYKRPDGQPNNAKTIIVDPGLVRTPGMRRWLTMGSLWGLLGYLISWPLWWLVLKSPDQAAQGFLHAVMDADLGRERGGKFMKECKERKWARAEIEDEGVAKRLWEFSEKQVEALEKEGAVRRAVTKKVAEELAKQAPSSAEGNVTPVSTTTGAAQKTPGSRRSKKA